MNPTKMRKPKITESRPRTALVYIRASTQEDLGAQRAAMARLATARNYTITDWRIERGPAGPELESLREDIRAGHVRTVLVSGLDRLCRMEVELSALLRELHDAGCTLIAASDTLTTGATEG